MSLLIRFKATNLLTVTYLNWQFVFNIYNALCILRSLNDIYDSLH